jgi:glucose-1-phosphate thymidylyltransferase
VGVKAGSSYVDVGTLGGYRSAITLLSGAQAPAGANSRADALSVAASKEEVSGE